MAFFSCRFVGVDGSVLKQEQFEPKLDLVLGTDQRFIVLPSSEGRITLAFNNVPILGLQYRAGKGGKIQWKVNGARNVEPSKRDGSTVLLTQCPHGHPWEQEGEEEEEKGRSRVVCNHCMLLSNPGFCGSIERAEKQRTFVLNLKAAAELYNGEIYPPWIPNDEPIQVVAAHPRV